MIYSNLSDQIRPDTGQKKNMLSTKPSLDPGRRIGLNWTGISFTLLWYQTQVQTWRIRAEHRRLSEPLPKTTKGNQRKVPSTWCPLLLYEGLLCLSCDAPINRFLTSRVLFLFKSGDSLFLRIFLTQVSELKLKQLHQTPRHFAVFLCTETVTKTFSFSFALVIRWTFFFSNKSNFFILRVLLSVCAKMWRDCVRYRVQIWRSDLTLALKSYKTICCFQVFLTLLLTELTF